MATNEGYKQKLLDPRWQKLRLEVFERDGWTCQLCGSKSNTLHVHHARYASLEPWETPSTLLFTACADCHHAEHNNYKDTLGWMIEYLGEIGIRSSLDLTVLLEWAERGLKSLAVDRARDEMSAIEKAQAFGQALTMLSISRNSMLEDSWRIHEQA